ncbi:bolA-like protein 3 [Eucyclogobius newberryi]|uniref:bolA-like protein 3 n=1 Tax=Eucyclogobius newberryi TaxID=166745 RepID=UPI003B5C81C5
MMLACRRTLGDTMITAHRILYRKGLFSGLAHRYLSSQTEGEGRIVKILQEKFPMASSLKVVDISGGCGAMYEIHIESSEFKGKRTIQQHQLVNQALKEEIQGMHGLRIFTEVPKN